MITATWHSISAHPARQRSKRLVSRLYSYDRLSALAKACLPACRSAVMESRPFCKAASCPVTIWVKLSWLPLWLVPSWAFYLTAWRTGGTVVSNCPVSGSTTTNSAEPSRRYSSDFGDQRSQASLVFSFRVCPYQLASADEMGCFAHPISLHLCYPNHRLPLPEVVPRSGAPTKSPHYRTCFALAPTLFQPKVVLPPKPTNNCAPTAPCMIVGPPRQLASVGSHYYCHSNRRTLLDRRYNRGL